MGMESPTFAMEFRDLIKRMVGAELERVRPKYKYATVVSIDRANYKATVRYAPGETPVPVTMSGVQPRDIGARVRVSGVPNDRYISEVLGPVYVVT